MAGDAMAGRGVAAPAGTVVIVNLVGGVDGLSVLVPFADPDYARRRPGLAVGAPGERYGAIDLGRGVGLHPALGPLFESVGRAERLALIGGVGVPDEHGGDSRHRPSREFVDRGGRDETEGWAARLLRFEGMGADATWSFGDAPHPVFAGLPGLGGVAVDRRPASVGVGGVGCPEAAERDPAAIEVSPGVDARWSNPEWVSPADRLARGYPEGHLARSLAATADLIRAEPGVRLVTVEQHGYDTHVDQGDGRSGVLAHKLDRLGRALAAFWTDVTRDRDRSGRREPVTVVVVSEFGRAIDENDSGGTEHGRGGVAIAMGDRVVGGVHGDLPALAGRSVWPVSIDVRRVVADAVASHGFRPWRGGVFPRLPLPNRSLGLLLSP